jgi:hypothetical protein
MEQVSDEENRICGAFSCHGDENHDEQSVTQFYSFCFNL